MSSEKVWLPLESNPEVMNKFLHDAGVAEHWGFIDIIDLEEEHLDEAPSNVKAILMLFPTGETHDEFCQCEQEAIESLGQEVSDRVFFVKLEINNASGTVSLIHAIANSTDYVPLESGSSLRDFIDRTKDMTPDERGQELEMDDAICCAHDSVAKEGQTEAPDAEEDVNLHFITFVNVDGQIYELDPRKISPINHGATSPASFLKDVVAVCKQFMERDPENVNFSVMALVELPPNAEEEPVVEEPED